MGLAARVWEMFRFDRHHLRLIETKFIAPEIIERDDLAERRAKLAAIVAENIIPHLVRLHQIAPAEEILAEEHPTEQNIAELAHIVLGPDVGASAAYVAALRAQGLTTDILFTELLEPCARMLGDMWHRDECDFIDVTLGVARLQKLLALFNATHENPALADRRIMLIATVPGEQHHFGAKMVEQVLTASRWQVDSDFEATTESLAKDVADRWYAVVGLTLADAAGLDRAKAAIALVREASRNPGLAVVIGGPPFIDKPWLAHQIGADATARNATAAALMVQKLFDQGVLTNWGESAG